MIKTDYSLVEIVVAGVVCKGALLARTISVNLRVSSEAFVCVDDGKNDILGQIA